MRGNIRSEGVVGFGISAGWGLDENSGVWAKELRGLVELKAGFGLNVLAKTPHIKPLRSCTCTRDAKALMFF